MVESDVKGFQNQATTVDINLQIPQTDDQHIGKDQTASNGSAVLEEVCPKPPDGGWGWVVCLSSFFINGISFGILNSYGVLFVELRDLFAKHGAADPSVLSSAVGSVAVGATFLFSPVSSICSDKFGARATAFSGALLATFGLLLSSVISNLYYIFLTYGILVGIGFSFTYTPSLFILGVYFTSKLGLVSGISATGSAVFTIGMPFLIKTTLNTLGFSGTLQVLMALSAIMILCALTFQPLASSSIDAHDLLVENKKIRCCEKYLNFSIWKNRRYVIWIITVSIALFGYFVPYVHLIKYAEDTLPDCKAEYLVMCIGLSSGISRLFFGKIGDDPRVSKVFLQQLAFMSTGILSMLMIVAKSFEELMAICFFLGICDGCFICLIGPIAFSIVGKKAASQAIGFFMGICSIPLTVGPLIAGSLYDHYGNYQAAFIVSGVPPIVASILMFFINNRICQKHLSNPVDQHKAELVAENQYLMENIGKRESNISRRSIELVIGKRATRYSCHSLFSILKEESFPIIRRRAASFSYYDDVRKIKNLFSLME